MSGSDDRQGERRSGDGDDRIRHRVQNDSGDQGCEQRTDERPREPVGGGPGSSHIVGSSRFDISVIRTDFLKISLHFVGGFGAFLPGECEVRAMSLAAEAREAVDARPFLRDALRAGVVNYRAAADFLDLGDAEAVAAALRRYREDLPAYDTAGRDVRVTMHRGVDVVEGPSDAIVAVGSVGVVPDAGSETAVVAAGDVDARSLSTTLGRLVAEGIDVDAAGVAGESLAVVVGRRDGAAALRVVEDALDAVPTETD